MTFQDMKKKLVDKEHIATEKELTKLVRRLLINTLLMTLWLGVLTLATVGNSLCVFAILCAIVLFICLVSYASSGAEGFKKVFGLVKFWWVHIIVLVAVVVVLRIFNFL